MTEIVVTISLPKAFQQEQPIVIKYAKTNNNLTNTDRPGVNEILFSLNSGPYYLHRDIMAKCENTDSLF